MVGLGHGSFVVAERVVAEREALVAQRVAQMA